MLININGRPVAAEEATVSVTDGAVLFGDTLFETLKARCGTIRFMDAHLDRIELSARLLAIPMDRPAIGEALAATASALDAPVARLRLTLTRGPFSSLAFPDPAQGGFVITAAPYAEPSNEERRQGAACVQAPNGRVNPLSHLPQMKRGNYADCLYAANHARSKGAREALFVTDDGHLLEGATSNLFVVAGGALVTPPAGELVLAGIMRRQILEAARQIGLETVERPVSVDELHGAEEAFLSNALIEILPIASFEGQPVGRGTTWKDLLDHIATMG